MIARTNPSAVELAALYRARKASPVEVTQDLLATIARLDPKLASFCYMTPDLALAQARRAEETLAKNPEAGPLVGIPYAAKDLIDVAGTPTSAGCSLLAKDIKQNDATLIEKLTAEGMVLLGKTHTVQFAGCIVGINHDMGTPHNPHAQAPHVPGGSSSGSAVAVAAGLVPMAIGSDTGGSIRAPAALCGTVGFKPTVGRVSRHRVHPLSATLDSMGPLTRSVEDAVVTMQAMLGADPHDAATLNLPPLDLAVDLKKGVKGLRLIVPKNWFFNHCDPEVKACVMVAADLLEREGAELVEMNLPEVDEIEGLADIHAIVSVEGYADHRWIVDDQPGALDSVNAWMFRGRNFPADRYFSLLQRRADIIRRFNRRMEGFDAILSPTCQAPALPVAEVEKDKGSFDFFAYHYLRNTQPGNHLNLCGFSVPCGLTAKGLPVGLQILAPQYQEAITARVAYAYERAAGHKVTPDLSWI